MPKNERDTTTPTTYFVVEHVEQNVSWQFSHKFKHKSQTARSQNAQWESEPGCLHTEHTLAGSFSAPMLTSSPVPSSSSTPTRGGGTGAGAAIGAVPDAKLHGVAAAAGVRPASKARVDSAPQDTVVHTRQSG